MGKILNGHILDVIDHIDDQSIECIVTSPPYWGLRDYGEDTNTRIWDGVKDCEHEFDTTKRYHPSRGKRNGKGIYTDPKYEAKGSSSSSFISQFCIYCNAWKGQLGLEPTFELFIKHLVDIFEALKPKLNDEGSLWVNLGDTYAGGNGIGTPKNVSKENLKEIWDIDESSFDRKNFEEVYPTRNPQAKIVNVKDKSQIGIPERFKIAMIDNGWICRNTVIWHKPAPMPQPYKDRYTNDFEYFFFFTKQKYYYFKQQLEPFKSKKPNRQKGSDVSKYESLEEEKTHRQGINKSRGSNWVRKRILPPQHEFVDMIREWIMLEANSLTKAIEDLAIYTEIKLSTIQHWFRKDDSFSYPTIEDWEKVEQIYKTKSIGYDFNFLVDYYEETDHDDPRDRILKVKNKEHKEKLIQKIEHNDTPYAVQNRDVEYIVYRELPPLNIVVDYLKEARSKTDITIRQIEEHFGNSKGHHWFESDNGSIPSPDEWLELKSLLDFDDTHDEAILTEFAKSSIKKDSQVNGKVGRNKRTTWTINTANFPEAHFAVYPRELIRSPIDACVPLKVCVACNKPQNENEVNCDCQAEFRKGVVFDPFLGSGTTAVESIYQDKEWLGSEINMEYAKIAQRRISQALKDKNIADNYEKQKSIF